MWRETQVKYFIKHVHICLVELCHFMQMTPGFIFRILAHKNETGFVK